MRVMSGNPDSTPTASEDHEAIREAVCAVAEDKIAPWAAAVDEDARYPVEAHDALVASDFFAPHVPEEYGGVGADALATCIVIEEVARVCASKPLIPAVNKPRSLPLVVAANGDVKRRYLTCSPRARRRSSPTARPSGRQDRHRLHAVPGRARRRRLGHRAEVVDHECRCLAVLHRPGGHRPRRSAGQQHHRLRRGEGDEGFSFGEKERKLGIKGSPTRELIFERTRIPGDRVVGEVGAGLKIALATPDHTRVTIGAQAVGIAQGALDHAVAYVKERRQFGRAVADFQGVQFMLADMAMEPGRRPGRSVARPSPSAATPTCPSVPPPSATRPTSPWVTTDAVEAARRVPATRATSRSSG